MHHTDTCQSGRWALRLAFWLEARRKRHGHWDDSAWRLGGMGGLCPEPHPTPTMNWWPHSSPKKW